MHRRLTHCRKHAPNAKTIEMTTTKKSEPMMQVRRIQQVAETRTCSATRARTGPTQMKRTMRNVAFHTQSHDQTRQQRETKIRIGHHRHQADCYFAPIAKRRQNRLLEVKYQRHSETIQDFETIANTTHKITINSRQSGTRGKPLSTKPRRRAQKHRRRAQKHRCQT
jgi:hypothetical protein